MTSGAQPRRYPMTTPISLDTCKGYKTEANLQRALERTGLADHECRRIICRKADGTWTAIFMVGEYLNRRGGYACFASQFGFMSI
jgi:hypothetical protein